MIRVCKDCKDRCADPNCHMTCERYLTAKAEFEDEKAKIRDSRKAYEDYKAVKQKNIAATMKKVNR